MNESEKAIRHALGEGSIAAVHGACNHRSIGALLVELDDARLDAKRYQWLRDTSVPPHVFYLSVPDEFKDMKFATREVDAAIDAALAQQEGKP